MLLSLITGINQRRAGPAHGDPVDHMALTLQRLHLAPDETMRRLRIGIQYIRYFHEDDGPFYARVIVGYRQLRHLPSIAAKVPWN